MKNQHKNPPTKAFLNNVKWRDLHLMMPSLIKRLKFLVGLK